MKPIRSEVHVRRRFSSKVRYLSCWVCLMDRSLHPTTPRLWADSVFLSTVAIRSFSGCETSSDKICPVAAATGALIISSSLFRVGGSVYGYIALKSGIMVSTFAQGLRRPRYFLLYLEMPLPLMTELPPFAALCNRAERSAMRVAGFPQLDVLLAPLSHGLILPSEEPDRCSLSG